METKESGVSDVPSAAAVLAAEKREARRRKILENSQNRLAKIGGREAPNGRNMDKNS